MHQTSETLENKTEQGPGPNTQTEIGVEHCNLQTQREGKRTGKNMQPGKR